jgi:chromosomal replication initiator protein
VVLFGPTGTGKSHLLQALGQLFQQVDRTQTVVYLTACELVDEYCSALVARTEDEFLDAEGPSLMLVDDLHFLRDRPRSSTALRQRINGLGANGTTVVSAGTSSVVEDAPGWVVPDAHCIPVPYPTDVELRQIAGVLAARRESAVTPMGLSALAEASQHDIRRLVGGLVELEAAAKLGFLHI